MRGKRFGRLRVLREIAEDACGNRRFVALCTCGNKAATP